jgi:hypothetical protein
MFAAIAAETKKRRFQMLISEKWWLRIIIGSFIACGAYATSGAAESTNAESHDIPPISRPLSK